MSDPMQPIFDKLTEEILNPPPAPEPKACCKCTAYREIIADQAREIERVRALASDAGEWVGHAAKRIAKIITKP